MDKTGLVGTIPAELSEGQAETLLNCTFENRIVPYLNGTAMEEDGETPVSMPDLFVIDHGHNDVRPKGIDGKNDLWIEPSVELINSGVLAEDTYMTDNDYANLKTVLRNDLSGISDKASFAASLNRNCFKGAVNFLITVILSYNPYARFAIVSDYD